MEVFFWIGVVFGIIYVVCGLVVMEELFRAQLKELKNANQFNFWGVFVAIIMSIVLGATWIVMPFLGMIREIRNTAKEIK